MFQVKDKSYLDYGETNYTVKSNYFENALYIFNHYSTRDNLCKKRVNTVRVSKP